MILYVLCNSELDLPSKTAKVRPFTKINIPINIRTMQLNSSDCISPIEINWQKTEEAARLFNWGYHTTPTGPQFFTKSAFEGDTANHDQAT